MCETEANGESNGSGNGCLVDASMAVPGVYREGYGHGALLGVKTLGPQGCSTLAHETHGRLGSSSEKSHYQALDVIHWEITYSLLRPPTSIALSITSRAERVVYFP